MDEETKKRIGLCNEHGFTTTINSGVHQHLKCPFCKIEQQESLIVELREWADACHVHTEVGAPIVIARNVWCAFRSLLDIRKGE